MSRITAEKSWQGRSFDGPAVGGVYRHPLARGIIASNDSCFGLPPRSTASVRLDLRYASRIGQGVIDVSRGILASLDRGRSRLPTMVLRRRTVYSRSRAPREYHHRKEYRQGEKGEAAMAFGYTIMAYIEDKTPDMLRPSLRNREGKEA